MNKGNFVLRHTLAHKQVLNVLIEGHAAPCLRAAGGTTVTEDQLRTLVRLGVAPNAVHILHALHDFAAVLVGQAAVYHALGVADFLAVVENLENMIFASALTGSAQRLGALAQLLHELLLERAGVALHNNALTGFHFGDFQVRQIRSVHDHVSKATEHLLHFSQVLVLGKALLQLVAVTAGFHFADCNHVAELVCPCVEVGQALCVQQVAL